MSGNGKATKPTFAMFGAGSCGGCDIAVVTIHEAIRDVAAVFDVVFWPTIMDAKYRDVEAMADGSITVCLYSGGLRTNETIEMARLLRRKSQFLVSFGSCASEGCIPGLANLSSRKEIFDTAYSTVSTDNPDGIRPVWEYEAPEGVLHLPVWEPVLTTLDKVVEVDYTVPGCPPESDQIASVMGVLIKALKGEGELPPKGSVLGAGNSTVCDECRRTRGIKKIKAFRRYQEVESFVPMLCLLEQGIPCNGSATRSGCGAKCPRVTAPCTGCYGPAEGVVDYGARLMSAFATVVDATDPGEIDRILDGIPDPVGQFYRFSLAGSLLGAGRKAVQSDGE